MLLLPSAPSRHKLRDSSAIELGAGSPLVMSSVTTGQLRAHAAVARIDAMHEVVQQLATQAAHKALDEDFERVLQLHPLFNTVRCGACDSHDLYAVFMVFVS